MPISPENKLLYPDNWDEIRERIRSRAHDKCEHCGLRNHSVGYRDQDGSFVPDSGNMIRELAGEGHTYPCLKPISYKEARDIARQNNIDEEHHYIVIVLTVAHLDHNPANCEDENLAFLCQKCHNNLDIKHRIESRRKTKLKGQMALSL